MSPKRLKYTAIGLTVLAAAVVLLSSTQLWFTLTVGTADTGSRSLAVSGAVAAPAMSALGFAALALAAALAIAGPVIRIILGVLGLAVGGSVVLAASLAIADPVAAGASVVTAATGVSGPDSIDALVTNVASTAWPVVGLIGGILLAIVAIAVIVTARAWPASSRRYQAVRMAPATSASGEADAAADPTAAGTTPDTVDEWDELSRGDDPTA